MWISQEKAAGGCGNQYRVRRETDAVSGLVLKGRLGPPVQ